MNPTTYSCRIVSLLVLLFTALHVLKASARAAEPLKVICASRASAPPVIDGVLDDECWKQIEVRNDFVSVTGGPVKRKTTMRLVFDDENLYLGIECYWDDIEILKKGIAKILEKYGPPPSAGSISKDYSNTYGMELFLDAGATRINYYQILFNAAGQYTGNYKMITRHFRPVHTIKSVIRGNCWSVELVYPHKGIRIGDVWGLNLCRNDETYYSN